MGTYANFYNSDNGDRIYDAEAFAEWLKPFFKTGVFNNELQVVASSGMNVVVKSGNAYIEGKLKKFDNETVLTLETASSTVDRIDAIVVRRNDTERDFTIQVIKGSTNAPQPIREGGIYDIVLAHISVPKATTQITTSLITDTRMNSDICGWVVSNVEEVDFSQVTAQWADYIANFEADELQAFNEWFDTIKGQLSTDQAGSLQLQIDEQANKIATNTANISANKADITSLQQTTSKNTSDIATNKANIANISPLIAYPIGSVYFSVNDTNPSTILGGGTWELIGSKLAVRENVLGNGYSLGLTNGNTLVSLGSKHDENWGYDLQAGHTIGTTLPSGGFSNASDYQAQYIGIPTKSQLGDNPQYSGLIVDTETIYSWKRVA